MEFKGSLIQFLEDICRLLGLLACPVSFHLWSRKEPGEL